MSKTFTHIIETKRLILRPFTMEDVEPSYQMNLDPEITKYTGDGGVIDRETMRRRIKGVVEGDYKKYGFGRFALEDKVTGEFIGFSGLKYLDDYQFIDLGYRLKKSYWGKGIATESCIASLDFAFNTLNLNELYAFAIKENKGSIRVLEKLGFNFEKEIVDDGLNYNQNFIFKHG